MEENKQYVDEELENEVDSSIFEEETNTESAVSQKEDTNFLTVYKRKSTYKGAGEDDFWYSATRSDGNSVVCKFKCDIGTKSMAFRIKNIMGALKRKEVDYKGEKYVNYTYYITSCDFEEIPPQVLPF